MTDELVERFEQIVYDALQSTSHINADATLRHISVQAANRICAAIAAMPELRQARSHLAILAV